MPWMRQLPEKNDAAARCALPVPLRQFPPPAPPESCPSSVPDFPAVQGLARAPRCNALAGTKSSLSSGNCSSPCARGVRRRRTNKSTKPDFTHHVEGLGVVRISCREILLCQMHCVTDVSGARVRPEVGTHELDTALDGTSAAQRVEGRTNAQQGSTQERARPRKVGCRGGSPQRGAHLKGGLP